jgi:hypothetical protein
MLIGIKSAYHLQELEVGNLRKEVEEGQKVGQEDLEQDVLEGPEVGQVLEVLELMQDLPELHQP